MWNRVTQKKRPTFLWVVSGPSGSGKTTLSHHVLRVRSLRLVRSISMTTRKPRHGERNGRDYRFVSTRDFKRAIKHNELLEWQKIFDCYYGTPKQFVLQSLKKRRDVLLCIDVKGAQQIKQRFAHRAIFVFVVPPSKRQLVWRIKKRGGARREDMCKRLQRIQIELRYGRMYDFIIVNDSLADAANLLESIIRAKRAENVIRTTRKNPR